MKTTLKQTLLLATLIITTTINAQTQLKGKVVDSQNGTPLQNTTVILMTADTTQIITGTITQADGTYNIPNIKNGNYTLKISYVGYHNFLRAININNPANHTHNIGTTLLTPNSIQLKQAIVTAQLPQVEVKDDTIMFNADAFQIPEGSVLEELVRKLPGVDIDDNGTIKINGKTITKILVDGKEFFGNDRNMAMKNLPTEIIDKIKTYDKQSDMTRITGIDDGEEETVMDLTIKKGMKGGWMGRAALGYGTHNRWANNLNINQFKDEQRTSIIGALNNTNDRTGSGGGRTPGNGDNISANTGANIVYAIKNLEIGGNARYRYNRAQTWSKSATQNFVTTRGSYSNRTNNTLSHNQALNSDLKIEWKPDTTTNIILRPTITTGNNDNQTQTQSLTFNTDPYTNPQITDPITQKNQIDNTTKINDNTSDTNTDGNNYALNTNLIINRRIPGRPWFGPSNPTNHNGRNISIRATASTTSNQNHNYNHTNTIYHQRADSTDLTYRYRNTPTTNHNYTAGITWSEPITRTLFLQANYAYNHTKRHTAGQTYDFAKADQIGQTLWQDYGQYGLLPPNYYQFLSDSLSKYTDNTNNTHSLELTLRLTTKQLNITAGIRTEKQQQTILYQYQGLDTLATRTFTRITPTLNARLRFTRQHTLQLTYRGQTQQPEITDLFNLTDNTNPLNIKEGNPQLKPAFNNNITLRYNHYYQQTQRTIFINTTYTNTHNSISQRTTYNEQTGGQITQPVNTNGNWKTNTEIGFNTPLPYNKLTLNTTTAAEQNNRVSYLYQNHTTQQNNVKSQQLTQRLALTLRLNNIDLKATTNIRWQKTTSKLVQATNQSTYNYHYELSSTGNLPNGLSYTTNIGINTRRGYSAAEMNTNELLWNAQLSYRFLQRKATITLAAYDILQQRSNISRQLTANARTDTENNSINSYYMLTLQYRFNQFGTRQARNQLRQQHYEPQPYDQNPEHTPDNNPEHNRPNNFGDRTFDNPGRGNR